MDQLVLHEDPISGNCYKIQLTASLLGLPLVRRPYDIWKGETRTPEFLTNINPFGQIPVLQVGTDSFIPESGAACFFLADGDDQKGRLIPEDRLERTQMLRWMFFEQNQHETSVAVLRSWARFTGLGNLSEEQKGRLTALGRQGERALTCMEAHMQGREWFVGKKISLADVVLFAYTQIAHEGGFEMENYPALNQWIARVKGVEGFVKMDGVD
jgi:glutathione S-transferase